MDQIIIGSDQATTATDESLVDNYLAAAFGGHAAQAEEDSECQVPSLKWVPFPVQQLPEPHASYVVNAARARQCDSAAVALPLLASLSGAIGATRTVRIGVDWYAPAVLWVAVVAPSGDVKTPAFRAALAAVEEIDRIAFKEWNEKHVECETEHTVYEAELADWRRAKPNERGEPPEAPAEPTRPRMIVEDVTMQALGRVLVENPHGLLLARDELSGWVRSFDQFTTSAGADLPRWLEIYRAGPLRVDRAGNGSLFVPRAAVSICGTIQTDILPRVFEDEHQAAGLLARFLLAAPPEPSRQWGAIQSAQMPDVAELVKRFKSLRKLDLPEDGKPTQALELAPEAVELYGNWFTDHEARRRTTGPGPWRSALAKLEEMPGRIALVLALARAGDPMTVQEVDEDTMCRALRLTDWFLAEGERVYSLMAETPESRQDRELREWVSKHSEGFVVRDVVRGHHRYRHEGGTAEAQSDLARLEATGDVVRTEQRSGRRGGHPTVLYHPTGTGDRTPNLQPQNTAENGQANNGDSDTTTRTPLKREGCVTVTAVPDSQNTAVGGSVTTGDETLFEGEL